LPPHPTAQAFASDAVVNWLLPQRTRRVARRQLMSTLELRTYVLPGRARVSRAQRALEEHHPAEPHHYIRWVGVRPGL